VKQGKKMETTTFLRAGCAEEEVVLSVCYSSLILLPRKWAQPEKLDTGKIVIELLLSILL